MLNSTQVKQAAAAMFTLKRVISQTQLEAISTGLRGEEGEYFLETVLRLANTFNTMPKTYEQDGKGEQAVAHLHYFRGGSDWYITERDMEDEQHQAFGLANLGYGGELGYISIVELIENRIELDFHFTPKTLADIKAGK